MSEATKRKLIYVASPLRGDYKLNMERAKQYCKMVVDQGFIPYAPHLLFTQFMDDTIPEEREAAMAMGREMLKRCDELWVFGEVISEGMASEIELAKELGIPIRSISIEEVHYQKRMIQKIENIIMGKRDEVLKAISPIMEAFGIKDYDYEVNNIKETLRIYDTRICCTANSIDAIINEIIGYIFINRWCRYRSLGTFSTQAKNVIKRYWEKESTTHHIKKG